MLKKITIMLTVSCLLAGLSGVAMAQEVDPVIPHGSLVTLQDLQDIYGWQIMTQQERDQFRADMLNAKTKEELQTICREHRRKMQLRAQEMGVVLPEKPLKSVKTVGMGQGPGPTLGIDCLGSSIGDGL
jgi:hypothetical protein